MILYISIYYLYTIAVTTATIIVSTIKAMMDINVYLSSPPTKSAAIKRAC